MFFDQVVSAQQEFTFAEMQNRIVNYAWKTIYPDWKIFLPERFTNIMTECRNAIQWEILGVQHTNLYFNTTFVTNEFLDVVAANSKGCGDGQTAVNDLKTDENFKPIFEKTFTNFFKVVSELYTKGAKDFETEICKARVLNAINTFTDELIGKIKDDAVGFKTNATKEFNEITKIGADHFRFFKANMTACFIKLPISNCRSCMLAYVRKILGFKYFMLLFNSYIC
jgi:hypothetical protein